LHVSRNPNYSEHEIIDLVQKCENLKYLDIYDISKMTFDGVELIKAISLSRPKTKQFEISSKHFIS
jgi:hypothetical protein